jgi:hypothetical protein
VGKVRRRVLPQATRHLLGATNYEVVVFVAQLRVLARTSLDGYAIGELPSRFPTMELLLDTVRARHSTELGAAGRGIHNRAAAGRVPVRRLPARQRVWRTSTISRSPVRSGVRWR